MGQLHYEMQLKREPSMFDGLWSLFIRSPRHDFALVYQEQHEQDRRKQILDQIMTAEARLRLSNIGT